MIRTVGGERDGRQGGRRGTGAVAAAVLRCVDDPMLRRQHGRAVARERVARMFRRQQIWEALRDDYHWLMRGKA